MMNEEEEEEERLKVGEFLRKEVEEWNDQVRAMALFKGFSGQRCDWEPRFLFWRDLILKVAAHLQGTFIIRPSRLQNVWFTRDGVLYPLCLHQVLFEMYNAGDLLRTSDLPDPRSGRLSLALRKAVRVLGFSRPSTSSPHHLPEDFYILSPLLKDSALEVVKIISENHWTSSCVITMTKFQNICGGRLEQASPILSYLSGCGKAKYLVINNKDLIEGVKIYLAPGAVSSITSLDYDILHLMWTAEKLEQQLKVIDYRCEKFQKSSVASLKSGNKRNALRHVREVKLASQSREKCIVLLNRVEEVLRVIGDAESSRKVSEAIRVGAQAMKENRISIGEIDDCLQELNESINSMKQVDEVLGSTPAWRVTEDEDIADELKLLELEVGAEVVEAPNGKIGGDDQVGVAEALNIADSLCDDLSNLNLKGSPARKHFVESSREVGQDHVDLEYA